jgi:hypothetical protein
VTAINAGQVHLLPGAMPARTVNVKTLPEWVSPASGAGHPDQLASRTLEGYLKPEADIRLTLNELLGDRRVEVRSLSVRCLGYLGQFEPFVDELTNAAQKSYWDDAFDTLQAALARGPASAAEVRIALERLRGADAALLYRLLWGYSPEQLENVGDGGGAAELVGLLEHERMDLRVLAFENLRRITGKTLLYRPELTNRNNQSYVQRWREALSAKEIVYVKAPTPMPELDASTPMPGATAPAAPGTLPAGVPASPLEGPMPTRPATTTPASPPPVAPPPVAPPAPMPEPPSADPATPITPAPAAPAAAGWPF